MNNSTHLIEQVGADGDQNSRFLVLDEVTSLGSMLPLEDFSYLVDERIAFWTRFIAEHCHSKPVLWRHWSDQAAFVHYNSALGGFDHMAVALATGGRVMLAASPKGRGSVFKRVDLLRRLLYQNRLFVSARCPQTI